MDAKLQRRVQRYGWDHASATYERGWSRQLEPGQSLMLELAGIRRGEHVLDVACGTGLVTFQAASRAGLGGRVLGLDLSGDMVRDAALRARDLGITNVRFARRDAEELATAPEHFDVALCGFGLMYVPHPLVALREMHAALKPSGRVAVAVWGARTNCGWAEIFPIVDRRVRSEVCPLFFRLGTGDALAASLKAAGFDHVRVERIRVSLDYANAEEALEAAFAAGPVALAYSRFDAATREAAHLEYLKSIAPYRTSEGGYRVPGEFVVGSALKADQKIGCGRYSEA